MGARDGQRDAAALRRSSYRDGISLLIEGWGWAVGEGEARMLPHALWAAWAWGHGKGGRAAGMLPGACWGVSPVAVAVPLRLPRAWAAPERGLGRWASPGVGREARTGGRVDGRVGQDVP